MEAGYGGVNGERRKNRQGNEGIGKRCKKRRMGKSRRNRIHKECVSVCLRSEEHKRED